MKKYKLMTKLEKELKAIEEDLKMNDYNEEYIDKCLKAYTALYNFFDKSLSNKEEQ